MRLKERIESFAELGGILRDALSGTDKRFSPELSDLITNLKFKNPWFTPENVSLAVKAISDELTYENLITWTNHYPSLEESRDIINVGVVMAGNIPLAGFHDFLSVLISGNNLVAKTSSKDKDLLVFIQKVLCEINSGFESKSELTDGFLRDFQVVIATGSDNSSRYFEYYFGKYPNIIRKNRNSIAVINGNETEDELRNLGLDIFSYFGLGCRNVSKIFFPEGYNIKDIVSYWNEYSLLLNHNKYANNYDYNKAIFLVNREHFIDTGYMILKESDKISSPVSVVHYEFFKSADQVEKILENENKKIQCIVGRNNIPFGKAQFPKLWEYADGIDTMEFLLKKN